ncbi:hypothetical protein EV424DRAFT_41267 [Suillus variegatus]|nr:hypothetical protein EV424DRAFT_41267 [Suillus variegatus]
MISTFFCKFMMGSRATRDLLTTQLSTTRVVLVPMLYSRAHTASYLYARATKAVSLVPLVYYADRACERARCYLDGFLNSEQLSAPGSSSRKGEGKGKGKGKAMAADEREAVEQRFYDAAPQAWGKGVHPNLKETMFYI